MFESAVLDSASTHALLWIARSEGLLQEDRWATDGFIDSRVSKPVPIWLRDQLLEQIVLTPAVTTFQRLPSKGLTGEILDRGFLTSIEDREIDVAPLRVPAEMVIGALHATGHPLSWQEVQARFERAWLAEVEAQKFEAEQGRPLPTDRMWVFARMNAFFAGKGNNNDEPPEGYIRQDVEMAMRHRAARWDAQPIVSAIDELLKLFGYAEQTSVLFRPAIVPTRGKTIPVAESHENANRAGALFRIVSRRLDAPTHGSTLRGTLDIARDPAAASLRQHLPLWLKELALGNTTPPTFIEREIRRANEALARRAKQARAGRVIGYFTVPIAVAEFLLQLPPVAGLSIQFVSEVVKRKAAEGTAEAEWVHFGSRRS